MNECVFIEMNVLLECLFIMNVLLEYFLGAQIKVGGGASTISLPLCSYTEAYMISGKMKVVGGPQL